MKFSLVLATVNRTDEVARYLRHLHQQTYQDFELIIVDQNQDDFLLPILIPYQDVFPIVYIQTDQRGLSRARNLGLAKANGDIVGFPDDDCWYPPELLEKVHDFFISHPRWDGLTGRSVDFEGKTVANHFDNKAGPLTRYNAFRRCISFTMFLRRQALLCIRFDEQLGVGAGTPWGSGEETDYLLQLLGQGFWVLYDPALLVFHPDPLLMEKNELVPRGYSYGCGLGRTLKKNNYSYWFFLYYLLRSFGAGLLALGRGDWKQFIYYWETTRGRIFGWHHG